MVPEGMYTWDFWLHPIHGRTSVVELLIHGSYALDPVLTPLIMEIQLTTGEATTMSSGLTWLNNDLNRIQYEDQIKMALRASRRRARKHPLT